MDAILNNPLFGILLSLFAFELGMFIFKKTKLPIFNPLLIAIAFVIGFLVIGDIDYATFNKGGQFINSFLGPATVILAVPLYKQIHLLKKHALPILVGILVGSAAGMVIIVSISYLLGLDSALIISLIPKSVTTPIGMEISGSMGGVIPITVVCIVVSGIIGAILAPLACKLFKIKDEVAVGVAIGTASHAVGTTKALEMGETQGAMSSLSIGIAGLMTVLLATPIYLLMSKVLGF